MEDIRAESGIDNLWQIMEALGNGGAVYEDEHGVYRVQNPER